MRVFVSTVYKNQELAGGHKHEYLGDWIDFSSCGDEYDFEEQCQSLHSDEQDPEFLFLQYEGFPSDFPKEILKPGKVNPSLFEYLYDCDEDERNVMIGYYECSGSFDLHDARDAFLGKFDSPGDFAYQLAQESGAEILGWIAVDWHASWENLKQDYCEYEKDGEHYIFSNI